MTTIEMTMISTTSTTIAAAAQGMANRKITDHGNAIVHAFTTPAQGQRTSRSSEGSLTITEFVALRIAGLQSDNTVRRYRNAWQTAMDTGHALAAQPGKTVKPAARAGGGTTIHGAARTTRRCASTQKIDLKQSHLVE